MVSPTQRTSIWANSGRQWKTEEPGGLQSIGSRRVGYDLATEQKQQQVQTELLGLPHVPGVLPGLFIQSVMQDRNLGAKPLPYHLLSSPANPPAYVFLNPPTYLHHWYYHPLIQPAPLLVTMLSIAIHIVANMIFLINNDQQWSFWNVNLCFFLSKILQSLPIACQLKSTIVSMVWLTKLGPCFLFQSHPLFSPPLSFYPHWPHFMLSSTTDRALHNPLLYGAFFLPNLSRKLILQLRLPYDTLFITFFSFIHHILIISAAMMTVLVVFLCIYVYY